MASFTNTRNILQKLGGGGRKRLRCLLAYSSLDTILLFAILEELQVGNSSA